MAQSSPRSSSSSVGMPTHVPGGPGGTQAHAADLQSSPQPTPEPDADEQLLVKVPSSGIQQNIADGRWVWPHLGWDDNGTMETYIFTLETKGNAALVDCFVQEDSNAVGSANTQRQSPFVKADKFRSKIDAVMMLSSFPLLAKTSLIQGNFMSEFPTQNDREQRAKLPAKVDSIALPGKPGRPSAGASTTTPAVPPRPCIYAFFLVNRRGDNPTKTEILEVIDAVEVYIKEAVAFKTTPQNPKSESGLRARTFVSTHSAAELALIKRIDEWLPVGRPTWITHNNRSGQSAIVDAFRSRGARRYVTTNNNVANAQTWITAIRRRLARVPQGYESFPLPWAITEVGWTVNPTKRLHDHKTHTGSNALLNLIEAVIGIILNQDRQLQGLNEYVMEDVILYNVPHDHFADVAEHLFSLLLRSYVWQGGLNAELGSIHDTSQYHVASLAWRKWEQKMDFGTIRACFTEEGRLFEENWALMEAILSSHENKRKRDAALAASKSAEQELSDEEQARLLRCQEVEKAAVLFIQKARADYKAASAARRADRLMDELVSILEAANITFPLDQDESRTDEDEQTETDTELTAERFAIFKDGITRLIGAGVFDQAQNVDVVVLMVNSLISAREFELEEVVLALQELHNEPSSIVSWDSSTKAVSKA